jgi:hypothetical protein
MSQAAPQTTRYRPEEILVAKSADIGGNAEWAVDSYRRIAPQYMLFTRFATEQTHDARIRVTMDAESNVLDEHADACLPLSESQLVNLFAHRVMLIRVANLTALAMTDYQFRYRYIIDDYTVAEKIRRGILKVAAGQPSGKWSSEELRLAKKFNLIENVLAGRLPYEFPYTREDRLKQRTEIHVQEVARCLDAIPAGSVANTALQVDVGPEVTAAEDEKLILFEVATDQPADPANGTFIAVDRDTDQPDYMIWNTYCFAGINHPENLWVPATERLYIHARSVAGEADFKIRYKYARCKLSIIDKIRWNLAMSSSEARIADDLDLWDRVVAGVAHKPIPY